VHSPCVHTNVHPEFRGLRPVSFGLAKIRRSPHRTLGKAWCHGLPGVPNPKWRATAGMLRGSLASVLTLIPLRLHSLGQ
jgi:hypothetical protein